MYPQTVHPGGFLIWRSNLAKYIKLADREIFRFMPIQNSKDLEIVLTAGEVVGQVKYGAYDLRWIELLDGQTHHCTAGTNAAHRSVEKMTGYTSRVLQNAREAQARKDAASNGAITNKELERREKQQKSYHKMQDMERENLRVNAMLGPDSFKDTPPNRVAVMDCHMDSHVTGMSQKEFDAFVKNMSAQGNFSSSANSNNMYSMKVG